MASQLGFSEFNKDDQKDELLSNMYKKRKNKTLRKRSKITSEKVETFLNSMKNVQRIEFPDCGHLIPLENPNEFATHLNQFVKKLS